MDHDKWTNKQINKFTIWQVHRQLNRQTDIHRNRKIDKETYFPFSSPFLAEVEGSQNCPLSDQTYFAKKLRNQTLGVGIAKIINQ